VFCRAALGEKTIDAASFSSIRLASGAAMLLLIRSVFGSGRASHGSSGWTPAALLFSYAISFSFAYMNLSTGTGALILFGMVQSTMIIAAIASGERPPPREWLGLFIALGGLVYLVSPGLEAPSTIGSVLMGAAGVSWGLYTLRGRGATDPLAATTTNFVRSVPFVAMVNLATMGRAHFSPGGTLLAVLSGSLASAIGYVAWYAALKELTTTRAAIVQLFVPALAAAGGVVFMSEALTLRLIVATLLILGGIGLATAGIAEKNPLQDTTAER